MKKKLLALFALEALLCAIFAVLGITLPEAFGAFLCFPFQQIGLLLRELSLSGSVGNGAAVALYIGLCLLPGALLLGKKKWHWEDGILPALSALMFPAMYLLINPHLQGVYLGWMHEAIGPELVGSVLWSLIAGYLVCTLLRRGMDAREDRLLQYLKWLLAAFAAAYVLAAFGTGLESLLASIDGVKQTNTEGDLTATILFLVISYLMQAMAQILAVWLLTDGTELVAEMEREPWSQAVLDGAEALSRRCARLLTVIVIGNLGFNLLQLLFVRQLRVIRTVIQLPLDVVAVVLGLLLAARLLRSHRQLKEENESFI